MRNPVLFGMSLSLVACLSGNHPSERDQSAPVASVAGSVPTGLPARMLVGLFENPGDTFIQSSGVPWDARYAYFTKGWVNNWGWGGYDGWWGYNYMLESDRFGTIPVVEYYQMNGEPGGAEAQFLAKVQNASTMAGYFGDFKILLQRVKQFSKPVLILVEGDGPGFLARQSGTNPNAYAAVAASGLPELSSLPNTVAGWGMAFLQLRNALGVDNAIFGLHVAAWASGKDISYFNVTDPLQPEVDLVYNFLAPFGLAPNATGSTYDVLIADPLDRDADYYRVVWGDPNRWWDASDTAPINSRSFNRYAEWLRLWNVTSQKRWILWQIPLGNSNHLNVWNNGGPREGYLDNRTEYFFGDNSAAHLNKFATSGVMALLFGAGAAGQANFVNDTYMDGQLFLKSRVAAYYQGGGLPIPPGPGSNPPPPPPPASPSFSSSAQVQGTPSPGQTANVTVSVTCTAGSMSSGIVDIEIYNSTGKVGQKVFENASFSSGQTSTYSYAWVPSQAGAYTVKVGVFAAGWSSLYHWNDNAGSFTVSDQPRDPAQYGFETGTQSWGFSGSVVTGISSTAAISYAGGRSLQVAFAGTAAGSSLVTIASPPVRAGANVSFHIWVPAGSALRSVQPFVQQNGVGGWLWTGRWVPISALTPGAWNTIMVSVPTNASSLYQLGVEFVTSRAWTGTCYVDSIGW